jgi:hypothetical protein
MLKRGFILLLLACGISGCASMENVDRSYVNHPALNLRSPNQLGEPAPASGLRNLKRTSGGGACSVCAN